MSLEMKLQETMKLASKIEAKKRSCEENSDSDGEEKVSPEKQEAKSKLISLKNTLQALKEQVLNESGHKKEHHKKQKLNHMRAQKITSWVQQIAKKVPVITQLEKRLGML